MTTDGDGPVLADVMRDLAAQADARWVQIADRVLAAALTAPRRSLPVRAWTAAGPVWIGEHVLTALIHDRLDAGLEHCALSAVRLRVRDGDVLDAITLVMVAQFGYPLLPMADRARELTVAVVRETLGPLTPPITVSALWVHVDDVTVGDPRHHDA